MENQRAAIRIVMLTFKNQTIKQSHTVKDLYTHGIFSL